MNNTNKQEDDLQKLQDKIQLLRKRWLSEAGNRPVIEMQAKLIKLAMGKNGNTSVKLPY